MFSNKEKKRQMLKRRPFKNSWCTACYSIGTIIMINSRPASQKLDKDRGCLRISNKGECDECNFKCTKGILKKFKCLKCGDVSIHLFKKVQVGPYRRTCDTIIAEGV